MMKKQIRKLRPVPTNCPYCKADKEPDYKQVEDLQKYLSERGKIIGKDRSGVCAKHQRRLSQAIKKARYLALMPFTIKPY